MIRRIRLVVQWSLLSEWRNISVVFACILGGLFLILAGTMAMVKAGGFVWLIPIGIVLMYGGVILRTIFNFRKIKNEFQKLKQKLKTKST